MAFPFFYNKNIDSESGIVVLDEETSKHVVQVLRMQNGEQLQLTDGKGNLFTTEITDNNRKRCSVNIIQFTNQQRPKNSFAIAVSLLKNTSRFEWLLEKATEIGVTEIIPLICSRTEKQNFRYDRMHGILISAMLQSQQTFLPVLHEAKKIEQVINEATQPQRFIAHCEDENNKVQLASQPVNSSIGQLVLIGPEGDFTKEEIKLALEKKFIAVALGNTRLRTETAALVAATLRCIH